VQKFHVGGRPEAPLIKRSPYFYVESAHHNGQKSPPLYPIVSQLNPTDIRVPIYIFENIYLRANLQSDLFRIFGIHFVFMNLLSPNARCISCSSHLHTFFFVLFQWIPNLWIVTGKTALNWKQCSVVQLTYTRPLFYGHGIQLQLQQIWGFTLLSMD
jgi:hypothetical protein